jgi:hypothetical protein
MIKTYGRFDKCKSSLYYEQYFTEGYQARLRAKAHKKMIQGIEKNTPGQTLKDIKQDLEALQEIMIEEQNKSFAVRTECVRTCGKIFQAVGVAIPLTIREVP